MRSIRVIDLPEYSVDVDQLSNEHYNVVLRRRINTGMSNIITHFSTEQEAIRGSQKFQQFFQIAKENGFSLNHDQFVHNDGRCVDVPTALDSSEFEFRSMLKR